MLQIGIGKSDITTFKEGLGMLGYGIYYNVMLSIETPLYARTFIFKNGHSKVAFVCAEICFFTPSLQQRILTILKEDYSEFGYTDENLMLNAQHTHSSPAGYSHHSIYNTITPGFHEDILGSLAQKIVESIISAESNYQEANISLGKGEFEPEKEVGFQRSRKAYLQNPEAKKISKDELHLGINREMTLLKITDKNQNSLGSINWFGTHTTSKPNTSTCISSDNKGYAATYFEEDLGDNFIAAFAQGSCGDVTPKYKYNKKHSVQRGKWDGKYVDATKSAQYNGLLQYEKAKEIFEQPSINLESDCIDNMISYTDFGDIAIDPKYCNGKENIKTSPACMGVAFLGGSYYDGPGMLEPLVSLAKVMSMTIKGVELLKTKFSSPSYKTAIEQKYKAQANKSIAMETGVGRIYGTKNISRFIIPSFMDEVIDNLKTFHKRGALDEMPWSPQVLPVQLFQIGNIVLAGFPFEITTIAAQRFQKTLENLLKGKKDIQEIILCPYSNAYNGYITTYEEYQVQQYEGGHTVFGEHSLAALQTVFEKMCIEFLKPKQERQIESQPQVRFTEEKLKQFTPFQNRFYKKWLKKKKNE